MIAKATVFAIVLLAPGFAFAADSGTSVVVPPAGAHDTAGAPAAAKSDVKSDVTVKAGVKTAKAKGHKNKTAPATEKKTETKS
jgi:hypothetical protein